MASKLSKKESTFLSLFLIFLKAIAIGISVSAVWLLLFCFVLSKKDIPLMLINPFAALLIAAASFISGYIAAKTIKQRGMAVGAGCGAIIFFFLAIISFMSSFKVGLLAVIKLAISLLSGAIGGILGVNSKRKRK